MSRRAGIITFIILALLAALGYWVSLHVEKREITIPVGLQGEAARQPMLAAQRYLAQAGIPLEPLEDTRRMLTDPAVNDALIITSDRQTLGKARTDSLLAWVRNGGHLIVTVPRMPVRVKGAARDPSPPRDPLLAALGLGLTRAYYAQDDATSQEEGAYGEAAEEDGYDEEKGEEEEDGATDTGAGSCPPNVTDPRVSYTAIRLSPNGAILRAAINQATVLTGAKKTDTVARHAGGVALVSRALGRGRIVILADLGIFQYRHIGRQDHAQLLWALVRDAGKVWVVTDNDMPPIWLWLWRHATETIAAALLFLLLWLWARAVRFGPLLTEPAPERRRILEHIEAAGRFLWQHRKQNRLLRSMRETLVTTAARRHPVWVGMSEEERIGHLASLTGQDPGELRHLLHEETPHRRQDFFHVIRKLETIRKKL